MKHTMTKHQIFMIVLFVVGLGFGIWVAFFAPCSALGWVPLKDLPARCLP